MFLIQALKRHSGVLDRLLLRSNSALRADTSDIDDLMMDKTKIYFFNHNMITSDDKHNVK